MATYAELIQAPQNVALQQRVFVATVVAAEAVRTESGATPNHANRLKWAKAVFTSPHTEADRMLWAVLAANKDATIAQITGASDTTVQTAVNAAVDVMADGN
jgi:hypothetical protein